MSILGVYFTFHMVGLVIWLGAAFLLPLAIVPAVKSLEGLDQLKFMEVFNKRFLPWFIVAGIAVGLSGLMQTIQMKDDLNLPIVIAKHFAILPLIAVSAYIWFYLVRKLSKPMMNNNGIWTQLMVFAWVQVALSVIVLILTGWLTG
jgi:uncharacterized membrane protein